MSAIGQNGHFPGGVTVTHPDEVTNALLNAILQAARVGSSASDTREMGEAAKAALAYAQAVVVLDPTLTVDGVPIEHETEMEKLRQAARAEAAAPSPVKKKPGGG